MSWSEYYRQVNPLSFGDSKAAYERAIRSLSSPEPEILNPNHPLNFVLGGFHPQNGTPGSFREFCSQLHNHPDDRHILLDQNIFPFTALPFPHSQKIQGQLENLPFQPASIDYLFLDHTLYFMAPDQVRQFAEDVCRVLKPTGLVLATLKDSLFYPLGRLRGLYVNRVPTYPRSIPQLCQLVNPSLTLVLEAIYKVRFYNGLPLTVFAKTDSRLPPHTGGPYSYTND